MKRKKTKKSKLPTKAQTTKSESAEAARWAKAERLLRDLRGQVHWEGDLKAMRRSRSTR
jgi:hypothetical protein